MKARKLLLTLVAPLLLSGCSSNSLLEKEVEVKMVSNFASEIGEGEYVDKVMYKDSWFLEDSYDLNYELALASAMTGGASYCNGEDQNGSKITKFLEDTGFDKIEKNTYYSEGIFLPNSMGAIIGQKYLVADDKEYTLLAVFPRNAGYEDEWVGNFTLSNTGIHTGFTLARDEVLRFMKQYIVSNEIKGDLKIWAAGYSRGAAIINLVSGFLADGSGYFGNNISIQPNDIYAYTIGTPSPVPSSISKKDALSVSGPREDGYHDTNIEAYTYTGDGTILPSSNRYDYVHNFVLTGDYVSKLPPVNWDFVRYGKTENFIFGGDDMITNLRAISPQTADNFANGRNYVTKEATSTFNFETFEIEDTDIMKSPNNVLDSHIDALANLVPDLKDFVDEGYSNVIGSLLAMFGSDYKGFNDGIASIGTSTLVQTLTVTYLSNVCEQLGLSDEEGVASFLMDLFELCGKVIPDRSKYTNQQFLADVFDLLINDYQKDENGKKRITKLTSLLPDPYGDLVLDLAKYAEAKEQKLAYFDDFLLLVSRFFKDNQTNEAVLSLVGQLASLVPEEYATAITYLTGKTYDDEHYPTPFDKINAALKDVLIMCVDGRADAGLSGNEYRSLVLAMVCLGGLTGKAKLTDLIMNGSYETAETRRFIDPGELSPVIKDILSMVLPVDKETSQVLSLKEVANAGLISMLQKIRTDKNAKYVDEVINNIELAKNGLLTLLFKPNGEYNLKRDIDNALTLYKSITFLFPSHFFELYVCYFKTKVNF